MPESTRMVFRRVFHPLHTPNRPRSNKRGGRTVALRLSTNAPRTGRAHPHAGCKRLKRSLSRLLLSPPKPIRHDGQERATVPLRVDQPDKAKALPHPRQIWRSPTDAGNVPQIRRPPPHAHNASTTPPNGAGRGGQGVWGEVGISFLPLSADAMRGTMFTSRGMTALTVKEYVPDKAQN